MYSYRDTSLKVLKDLVLLTNLLNRHYKKLLPYGSSFFVLWGILSSIKLRGWNKNGKIKTARVSLLFGVSYTKAVFGGIYLQAHLTLLQNFLSLSDFLEELI